MVTTERTWPARWCFHLAQAPVPAAAEIGGKAAGLYALVRAGLPVPDGFVIPCGALDDARLAAAIPAAARTLGDRLMVRSSATLEDAADAPFPGIFESVAGVLPDEVVAAAKHVIASASAPAAQLYAEALGVGGRPWEMAVIVQRQVEAPARGTVYSRWPGTASLIIEADLGDGHFSRAHVARSDLATQRCDPGFPLTGDERADLARLALIAEDAIAAGERGADIEWLWADGQPWLVQARAIARAARTEPVAPPVVAGEPIWVWDAVHNPDPLSPAQIGLVERVDAVAAAGAQRMRVIGGYLYYSRVSGDSRDSGADDSRDADAEARHQPPPDARQLREAWEITAGACDRVLAEIGESATLADCLRAYEIVARHHAGFSARAGHARAALVSAVAELGAGDPEATASRVIAAGAGHGELARAARAGDRKKLRALAAPLAGAWDVASPAFGEDPEALDRGVEALIRHAGGPPADSGQDALAALQIPVEPGHRERLEKLVAAATLAHDLAEDDDRWFFRAQVMVRRALLSLARRWSLARLDDVFWLPLGEVLDRDVAGRPPGHAEVTARAERARKKHAHQAQVGAPAVIAAQSHLSDEALGSAARGFPGLWRGHGTGGHARGRAIKLVENGQVAPDAADIAVVKTVTPGLALFAAGARGLVSEHGGLLGHGAALARQLGIPCVVGCRGVFAEINDGDGVAIDGRAGLVARIARADHIETSEPPP